LYTDNRITLKGVDTMAIGFRRPVDRLSDLQEEMAELEPQLNYLIMRYNKMVAEAAAIQKLLEA
jgi:hypothetical protein